MARSSASPQHHIQRCPTSEEFQVQTEQLILINGPSCTKNFCNRSFLVKHYTYMPGIIRVGCFDVEHSEVAIASTSARPVVTVHHAGDARRIIKSTFGLTGRRGLTRSRVLRLPEPPVALAVPLLGEDSIPSQSGDGSKRLDS
jgi:hypothetical protein